MRRSGEEASDENRRSQLHTQPPKHHPSDSADLLRAVEMMAKAAVCLF